MSETPEATEPEATVVSFVVEEDDRRLDKVVRDRVPELSRSQGQRLIGDGQVTVDGRSRKPAYRVEIGDQVTVRVPPPPDPRAIQPQSISIEILYEDAYLVGVNKPAGMVVHPAPGHPDGTLVNALLAYDPAIAQVGPSDRPGIVHRLDMETSGVLVVARRPDVLEDLQEQFRSREVHKTYLALVHGRMQPPEGIIEVPIGRHPHDRQRMAPLTDGKYARTRFHAVENVGSYTLVEAHPYTGRTHQIRVHLAWMGHPVVGDDVYGRRGDSLLEGRHFLHAGALHLTHPASGDALDLRAPLPSELTTLLEQLR